MKMIRLIIFLAALPFSNLYGQNTSVSVNKKECTLANGLTAYKIFVAVPTKDKIILSDNFGYRYYYFSGINDSVKLLIIDKLLAFEDDSSLCCLAPTGYREGTLDCTAFGYTSKSYNIQIDALFIINKIAFKDFATMYSCAPVLYDKITETEINDKPELIKEVYKQYKKWFNECKQIGKIKKYFPFNDGRYVWYGGKKSFFTKGE